MAEKKRKRMTKQDMEDWDTLYQYVCHNVLGYDDNQSLSRTMTLRLKGLLYGKFMENTSQEDKSSYSYKTVLNTFKFCYMDIQRALQNNTFHDENHKFNYILKIVEGKLNDVYIREKNAEKGIKEAENHDLSETANYQNTFKAKETKQSTEKYSDLW